MKLTKQQREDIRKQAKVFFQKYGEVELNKFNQLVLQKIPINYSDYVPQGAKLRLKCFFDLLTDIFYLREVHDKNVVSWYCSMHGYIESQIVNLLKKAIKDNSGCYPLSSIPGLLDKELRIKDYKSVSGGRGLRIWLESDYPNELKITKDGGLIYLASDEIPDTSSKSEAISQVSKNEISQMHNLSFMDWWSNNSKKLQQYTRLVKSQDEWSQIIAHNLTKAFLGANDFFCYTSNGTNKLVFNTGLNTVNGNTLYCVLCANPRQGEGLQPFMLEGFCCPKEDNSELVDEIKEYVPEITKKTISMNSKYEELRTVLEQLIEIRDTLVATKIQESLISGVALDSKTFSLIKQYYGKWEIANEIIDFLGWNADKKEIISIELISNRLAYSNKKSDTLNKAVDIISNVLSRILQYCNDNQMKSTTLLIEADLNVVKASSLDSYAELYPLLDQYLRLSKLTEETELTEDVDLEIDIITQYFKSLKPKILTRFFVNQEDEPLLANNAKELREASSLLSVLNTSLTIDTKDHDDATVDTDILLEKIMNATDISVFTEVLSLVSKFTEDKYEKAFVLGNYTQAISLLNQEDIVIQYAKTKEEIISELKNSQSVSEEVSLALYDCGMRIYNVFGNHNRVAERYFIAGLIVDSKKSSEALLKLYFEEDKPDKFYAVWNKFCKTLILQPEEFVFLLRYIAAESEEAVEKFLSNTPYYFYIDKYAQIINQVLAETNYIALSDRAKSCLSYINSLPDINEFEKLVIRHTSEDEFDSEIIKNYIKTNESVMETIGYTHEDLQIIAKHLEHEVINDIHISSIEKLYYLQKNKNGTVERFLWKSLLHNFKERNCSLLLLILVESVRFDEVCFVYECYENFMQNDRIAREAYLCALFYTQNTRVYKFACDNFQDCIRMLNNDSSLHSQLISVFDKVSANENSNFFAFINMLTEMNDLLDDHILKSIVLLSNDLREIAIDTENLLKFGLNQDQIDNFLSVYKTDSYSRKRSIDGVAERIFTFIGTCKNVAEKIATFAEFMSGDNIELLWKICCASGNIDKQFEILQNHPDFLIGKEDDYCLLLFKKCMFSKFLEESERLGYNTKDSIFQFFIAKCNLGLDIDNSLIEISHNIKNISGSLFADITSTMVEFGYITHYEDFIINHIDHILFHYNEIEVENIVSARGQADETLLKKLQKKAVAKKTEALIFYLYEHFHLGRYKGASNEYLNKMLAQYAECDSEEKQVLSNQLRVIYSTNSEYATKIVLNEIDLILSCGTDVDFKQKKVAEIIENIPITRDGLKIFMKISQDNEILMSCRICTAVLRVCTEMKLQCECIEYIHNFSSMDFLDDIESLRLLCELYVDALTDGYFKTEWKSRAQNVCLKLISTNHFSIAAYCLYKNYKHAGDIYLAKYILWLLLANKSKISQQLLSEIENESNKMFDRPTDIFDLFVEVAECADIEQLTEYCIECGKLETDKANLIKKYDDSFANDEIDIISKADSNFFLKILYVNPENIEYWNNCLKMPFETNPEAHTKILYKIALMNNKFSYWKKCIEACERYAKGALMSKVLLSCAQMIPPPFGLRDYREYLCAKSEKNPLYFAQTEEEYLVDMISVMCTRIKEDLEIEFHHNAIRDLSAIAIATDSAKVFDMMLSYLGERLYGDKNNLGFAVVCRLIIKKRFVDAQTVLKELTSASHLKYPKLIEKLSSMDITALTEWSSLEINNQLLNMILPDGNLPKIEEINDFALIYSTNGKAEEATKLICEIIENNPKDYGCYIALFMLCKQLPHRIDLLHKALCGLIQNNPMGSSKSYYTRDRKDYAIFLAKINAIIIAQGMASQNVVFDNYDFRTTAKDYYIKCESNSKNVTNIAILKSITEAQDNTQFALTNQHKDSFEVISSIIWASVTGNWYELILKCWRDKFPLKDYMEDYYEALNSNVGLSRSILKVVYSLESNERAKFMTWAEKQFNTSCKQQIDIASYIYNKQYYDKLPTDVLEANIFDLPFEEYSVFTQIYNNTVMQFVSKAPEAVCNCAIIVGALAMENRSMGEFWKTAMEKFESSNDVVSFGMFSAIYELNKKLNLEHKNKTEKDTRKMHEVYESMMRISGAFAGNETIIDKISAQKFKPHSCMNMVFALSYTSRANEGNRLKQYFCESNQALTDTMLLGFNPEISDLDKFSAVCSIEDEVTRGLLCYVFLKKNYKTATYWFLKHSKTARDFERMYNDIANNNPINFSLSDVPYPKKFIWIEPQNINANTFNQLEVTILDPIKELVPTNEPDNYSEEEKALSFVADFEPSEESDISIEQLWAEHESIYSFGLERYEAKLKISERIYRLALRYDLDQLTLNDYALRYGVDYYYYCIGNKHYQEANNIIIEMVNVYESNRDSEGSITLKKVVCSSALYELLYHGYTNIYALVENYAKNRQSFIRMRNMLPSSMDEEIKEVNSIYAALDYFEKSIIKLPQNATSAIRENLFKVIRLLGSIGVTGWSNVKALVHRMLQDEINKIDQRPLLTPEILSKNAILPYGSIFGQIKNIGNDIAENITIQISFADNTMSNPYFLPQLDSGETAAFEIPYSVADGVSELYYSIAVSFKHRGEQFSYVEEEKLLTIECTSFKDFDSGLYLTDRPINDFVALKDGTIHSENFFGREEEKRIINNMFNASNFINYKNVIIKGIRRAGKTSVLYYLKKYIEANCDDAIAIYIDCSGSGKISAPIHSMFVERVITESKLLNYANRTEDEWCEFEQKWQLRDGFDCDPEELQYFYRELKAFNGNKGLMLIVDEFDILLEAVETNKGVDISLLPSLRTLLNNVYCQEAIHLIICGSNKMIRYMDGGTFNQLFQQFGTNIIEIDKLLGKEMEEMLTMPLKQMYPFVNFKPEALNWIWRYTNGLVWYSKLIASYALERARANKRFTVYPSDVVHAVTTVVSNDDFFKSLVTSCTPYELKVLDALQGITSRATEYVALSKLLDVLSEEFKQKDVEGIINALERMQFVERNPYDRYSYRFSVQLYWHYFRKNPSNFDRATEIPVEFEEKKPTLMNIYGDNTDHH